MRTLMLRTAMVLATPLLVVSAVTFAFANAACGDDEELWWLLDRRCWREAAAEWREHWRRAALRGHDAR
jgi:hypothetical protein